MFLINSRSGLFTAASFASARVELQLPLAPLLPKLRGNFAEFLCYGSLEHLRILSSPTCVGLRYGLQSYSLSGFSRQSLRSLSPRPKAWRTIDAKCCNGGFSCHYHPTSSTTIQHVADLSILRPHIVQTHDYRYRNIKLFSIGYPGYSRTHLRTRLTLSRRTLLRKP